MGFRAVALVALFAIVVLAAGASTAMADSFALQAPASVVTGKDFVMTVSGSISEPTLNGAQLTIYAKPRSTPCSASPDVTAGLSESWMGVTPTATNGINWPTGVNPTPTFSTRIGASSDAVGAPSTYRLCGYLSWVTDSSGAGGTNQNETFGHLLAQTTIKVTQAAPDRADEFRSCGVNLSRISSLRATRATSCSKAVSDVQSFARSTCATHDGVLLKRFGGGGFAECAPQRRLECVALAKPRGLLIPVGCARLGALGFFDNERLEFIYRLRGLS